MITKVLIAHSEPAVYVYEAPMRLWHWINALSIGVLAFTGWLIGSPLPTMPGEASDHFVMGYIRFAHFAAAYILIVGFVFRVYWAIVGNSHSRQIFLPPIFNRSWWDGVWHEVKWYSFIAKEPRKYTGHNPLATLAMHTMLLWGLILMIVTGLSMYGEGEGMGSWQYTLFSSWVIPLRGPEPGSAFDPPPGHVADPDFRDHPHLCRDPRRHHVAPEHRQHHDQRLAHVQG